MRRIFIFLSILILLTACGKQAAEPVPVSAEIQEGRAEREIIEELLACYANYGSTADARMDELLSELKLSYPDTGAKWEEIVYIWRAAPGIELNYDVLPDGLNDTDSLAIVALGFQLAPDGSMRDELLGRLNVVKASAEKYPNALIICTGGPTASQDPAATEAGKMAEWLIDNGIAPERVIAEDRSLTTAQNAILSIDIITEQYPQLHELAIISSDYHIATGVLLFEAEAILRADDTETERIRVISNAAYNAPSGNLSTSFQAGALRDLYEDISSLK